jgi:hypothetical protein
VFLESTSISLRCGFLQGVYHSCDSSSVQTTTSLPFFYCASDSLLFLYSQWSSTCTIDSCNPHLVSMIYYIVAFTRWTALQASCGKITTSKTCGNTSSKRVARDYLLVIAFSSRFYFILHIYQSSNLFSIFPLRIWTA